MLFAASRVAFTWPLSAIAGLAVPAFAEMPATIRARSAWRADTLFSRVKLSSTAVVPITRSNFSPASTRFCTPPAVSLTTVTLLPVWAPNSAANALTGMDMPAPVRIFRSLAPADRIWASRRSAAGTIKRCMLRPFAPRAFYVLLRSGRERFIRDQTGRKAKGNEYENRFSRKRSNRTGDADAGPGRGGGVHHHPAGEGRQPHAR